jgi:dTDP-L-rhamnose 4-epimerase
MSRVLVTGGCGFIGSHLVRRLRDRGDDVVVVDSLEPQVHGLGEVARIEGVEYHLGTRVRNYLACVDKVAHLAAVVGVGQSMYEPDVYVDKNTLDTATFLRHSTDMERLVVASSMSIYGEGEYHCPEHGFILFEPGERPLERLKERRWEPPCPRCGGDLVPRPTRETKSLLPSSVYATTKRDQEELCLVLGRARGIPTMALRFFNVYGAGQALANPYTGVMAIFASAMLRGEVPVVFEDGLQTRDFVHVSDVVEALVLALDSDAVGAVNVGTGTPTSVMEVANVMMGQTSIFAVDGRYRAGDVRHCYADTHLAKRVLGFEARMTFEQGLRETVAWVREQSPVQVPDALAELERRGLVV